MSSNLLLKINKFNAYALKINKKLQYISKQIKLNMYKNYIFKVFSHFYSQNSQFKFKKNQDATYLFDREKNLLTDAHKLNRKIFLMA